MANRRKEIPSYVSIEVAKVRGIAESMEDTSWAKWSKKALDDLTMGCVRKDVDPIVKELYDRSKGSMDKEYLRKKEWYENKKKIPQDAPNGNAGEDVYDAREGAASKSPTSCDPFTADGDTREGSRDVYDTGDRGHLESATSATNYGDAAVSDAADGESDGNAASARTTVSAPMRRVPQNEAPAHGFSGGRTAQGTMSRSPEAAAQSGKAYALDSLPDKGKQPAKTRDSRASGRYAPPSCSPEDGSPASTAPSHGGSVASISVTGSSGSRRTGGNSVRMVGKVSSPPVRSPGPMPADKQQVYDFAAAEGLDATDAYECWHVTVNERNGLTADGKPVKNWKAYVRKWCETRAERRNA